MFKIFGLKLTSVAIPLVIAGLIAWESFQHRSLDAQFDEFASPKDKGRMNEQSKRDSDNGKLKSCNTSTVRDSLQKPVIFDPPPGGSFPFVLFSPDGKTLAFGRLASNLDELDRRRGGPISENFVFLCDSATGRELHRLEGTWSKQVAQAVFSPGGELLAVRQSQSTELIVWKVTDGKIHQTLDFGDIGVNWTDGSLIFSVNGKCLFAQMHPSKGFPGIYLWNLSSGKATMIFENAKAGGVRAYAVSNDFQYLVTENMIGTRRGEAPWRRIDYRITAHLWDVCTGNDLGRIGSQTEWNTDSGCSTPQGAKLLEVGAVKEGFRVKRISGDRFLVLPNYTSRQRLKVILKPDGVSLVGRVTGKEVHCFTEFHDGNVSHCVFSPDGNKLAMTGRIGKNANCDRLLLWDVSKWNLSVDTPAASSAKTIEQCWADLANQDGRKANEAMMAMAWLAEWTVPFIRERLKPVGSLDEVPLLIAGLDSEDFDTRENASRRLFDMGDIAEPLLLKSLKEHGSPEVRRRIQDILEKPQGCLPPNQLRALRSIDVLEQIATPAARAILATLAKGEPTSSITQSAQASLLCQETKK